MKNNMPEIIERYGWPSEHDTAPQYSLCVCPDEPNSVWLQIARNEESPQWEYFKNIYAVAQFLNKIKSL